MISPIFIFTIMEDKKYCINCGQLIPKVANICPHCGANQDTGAVNTPVEATVVDNQQQNQQQYQQNQQQYQQNQQQQYQQNYQQQAQPNQGAQPPADNTKWVIALILCFTVGYLGIHRFYLGHIGIGIIQLLTAGGCGIWVIIDLIMLLTGSLKDAQGNPLKP